jgi:glycosyltransferase involved in cell wall biosynthesis
LRLVIVGKAEWRATQVEQLAAASGFSSDILLPGHLSESMLSGLYRTCAAFVYPSLSEGFGLPILEAMACGAPVVTSNLPPMAEIAGRGAILVDPYSVESIAEALAVVLNDAGLRTALKNQGARQAASFTWERTARQTLEAYAWAVSKEEAGKSS